MRSIPSTGALLLLFLACIPSIRGQASVEELGLAYKGPEHPSYSYPTWYADKRGRRLELCLDGSMCLLDTLTGTASFPNNFPDEAFFYYCSADPDSQVDLRAGNSNLPTITLKVWEAALEGAFAVGPVKAGDQVVFSRIRTRMTVTVPGEYKVIHPWGEDEFTDVIDEINDTKDVGLQQTPFDSQELPTSNIGPFYGQTTFTSGSVPSTGCFQYGCAGYIGNPTVPAPLEDEAMTIYNNAKYAVIVQYRATPTDEWKYIVGYRQVVVLGKLATDRHPPIITDAYITNNQLQVWYCGAGVSGTYSVGGGTANKPLTCTSLKDPKYGEDSSCYYATNPADTSIQETSAITVALKSPHVGSQQAPTRSVRNLVVIQWAQWAITDQSDPANIKGTLQVRARGAGELSLHLGAGADAPSLSNCEATSRDGGDTLFTCTDAIPLPAAVTVKSGSGFTTTKKIAVLGYVAQEIVEQQPEPVQTAPAAPAAFNVDLPDPDPTVALPAPIYINVLGGSTAWNSKTEVGSWGEKAGLLTITITGFPVEGTAEVVQNDADPSSGSSVVPRQLIRYIPLTTGTRADIVYTINFGGAASEPASITLFYPISLAVTSAQYDRREWRVRGTSSGSMVWCAPGTQDPNSYDWAAVPAAQKMVAAVDATGAWQYRATTTLPSATTITCHTFRGTYAGTQLPSVVATARVRN